MATTVVQQVDLFASGVFSDKHEETLGEKWRRIAGG